MQNRVYKGKEYERWLITLPPDLVREMGWDERTELKVTKRKRALRLAPASDDKPA